MAECKKKFEAWFISAAPKYELNLFKGEYAEAPVACAWTAWQAAYEAAKQQPVVDERLQMEVRQTIKAALDEAENDDDLDATVTVYLAIRPYLASDELAKLREENERLRNALLPFAELAHRARSLGHEPDSTCKWRIRAADLFAADALASHHDSTSDSGKESDA